MKPDETHDPGLTSWVESANERGWDLPIQNLPFGIFRRKGSAPSSSCRSPLQKDYDKV